LDKIDIECCTWRVTAWTPVLASFTCDWGLAMLYVASQGGKVSLLAPLTALHMVAPSAYGLILRNEPRTPLKLGGIGAALAGTLALGFATTESSNKEEESSDTLVPAWA